MNRQCFFYLPQSTNNVQAAVDQFPEEPRRVLQGQGLPAARQDALLWGRTCWGGGGAQRVLSYP